MILLSFKEEKIKNYQIVEEMNEEMRREPIDGSYPIRLVTTIQLESSILSSTPF